MHTSQILKDPTESPAGLQDWVAPCGPFTTHSTPHTHTVHHQTDRTRLCWTTWQWSGFIFRIERGWDRKGRARGSEREVKRTKAGLHSLWSSTDAQRRLPWTNVQPAKTEGPGEWLLSESRHTHKLIAHHTQCMFLINSKYFHSLTGICKRRKKKSVYLWFLQLTRFTWTSFVWLIINLESLCGVVGE